jgi:hypothetical protein
MKYETELVTRPAAPLEIPQLEVVIPVPRQWFQAIYDHGYSPASMIQNLAVSGGDYDREGAESREDFPEVFSGLGRYKIPEGESVRMRFTMRRDIYKSFLVSASRVGKSPHEVALRIFARQLPLYLEHSRKPVRLPARATNLLPFHARA